MKHLLLVVLCIGGLHGQTHASQLEEEEPVNGWVFLKDEEGDLGVVTFSRAQSPVGRLLETPPPSPDENQRGTFIFDNPAYVLKAVNDQNVKFKTVEQSQAGDSQGENQKQKDTKIYRQPKELDLVKIVRDLELQKKDNQKEEQLVQCLQKEYLKEVGSYIKKEIKQSVNFVFDYAMNNNPEEAAIQLAGWFIKKTQNFFYPEE